MVGLRAGKAIAVLGAAVMLCWAAGFAWFVHAASQPAVLPPRADGIVVLTGGADRIVTGARMLQEGRGRVLLISGVGHDAGLQALFRGTGLDAVSLASRITLGRAATSTAGNADETASWAASHNVRSLFVVTAGYHMPRALTELQRSLPGTAMFAVPVVPPALRTHNLSTWRLLAQEYTKWLASKLGLARLAADPIRAAG